MCAPEKCQFGLSQVEYLGSIVSAEGITAKPVYVESLKRVAVPKSKKEVQSLLGAFGWLREHIPNLAIIMAPISELLKQNKFRVTPEAVTAIEALKEQLDRPMLLAHLDPDLPRIIQTDACMIGMGAVLYQEKNQDERSIIAYTSAKFSSTEKRYHINEKECLAIIWALKRFRPYLENRRVIVRTDSKCLIWLNKMKDSREKLVRWAILLQEFDIEFQHVPGRLNELPDFFSRNPDEVVYEGVQSEDIDRMFPLSGVHRQQSSTSDEEPSISHIFVSDEVFQAQQGDLAANKQRQHIALLAKKKRISGDDVKFLETHCLDDQGLWVRKNSTDSWRVFVPDSARLPVLLHFHDSVQAGHPGAEETERAIRQHFF